MIPITRTEMFLANAAGQSNGDLPMPVTREETYLNAVCERLDNIDKPTDEQVQNAVNNYLANIDLGTTITMQELIEYIGA